jgi:hypothetical protein
MFSLETFQRIFVTNLKKKKKRLLWAFVCPSWFKETGDFTVSEGIRLQIFRFSGDGFGVKEKKKGRHGRIVSDRHGHLLVYIYCTLEIGVRGK